MYTHMQYTIFVMGVLQKHGEAHQCTPAANVHHVHDATSFSNIHQQQCTPHS